ncbi:MAG: YihY/virulence factor BrkB family protein [Sphingomonadales bacterium]|jgi:membrane protein|uniref:YihY/virulence factor BrkB family protein n=1 Tax=Sphingorhabdus sp. TaxID=1902408 RepID=UPI003BAE2A86|nr:YihY/virulence factor BrkB family protein [Sphingomonadales bacterium]MBK9431191.1 YihY/virulence factor BrkB family protein [Sphingomonadales bacterium]MBL0021324.1 YihY/virulence factor BrkB family protein [Sphingomonadales bacterium]
MSEHSPLSPEARAHDAVPHQTSEAEWFHDLGHWKQSLEILKRVGFGVYSEGFVHAGNFAYLSLVALFAFCIVAAAIAGGFGQTESGLALIDAFFATVPKGAAEALRGPIEASMKARSGPLLWFSAAVSLWTAASLIETIRDVLHKAYGTVPERWFWHYRLGSFLVIIAAVVLAMAAFSAQVLVTAAEDLVYRYIPAAERAASYFAWGRIIPFVTLFATIYTIYRGLTPRKYRGGIFPKWPGAVLVSMWWLGCTMVLPAFVSEMAHYDLTYGSLAGIMVALIFFYLIGLGMVMGAQLNAALANARENGLKDATESNGQ